MCGSLVLYLPLDTTKFTAVHKPGTQMVCGISLLSGWGSKSLCQAEGVWELQVGHGLMAVCSKRGMFGGHQER